jgi:RNA polymerase sigma-70 factor (ECF subfamily)
MIAERDLLPAARHGQVGDLGVLLHRHEARMLAAALRILRDPEAARDAVQDACLLAVQRIGQVQDPAAVAAWLVAVVRSVCLMHLREARAERARLTRLEGIELFSRIRHPDTHLEASASRDWVWSALAQLPEGLRISLLLRHFGSYSRYDQIAGLLDIPVGTVRSRLAEGRARMVRALRDAGTAVDPAAYHAQQARFRFLADAVDALHEEDRRDEFLALFHETLTLRFAGGPLLHGREHWAAEVDGDLRFGTRNVPVRAMTTGRLTVLEVACVDPPEYPDRCPPGMALLLAERDGRFQRLDAFKAAVAPRPED